MVIRRGGTGKRFEVLAVLMAAVFLVFMGTHTVYGAGGLDLNTGYPGISAKPGDSLNVPVTLENYIRVSLNVGLKITAVPEGWEGYLQDDSCQVSRVHVKNGEEGAQVTLHVAVPKEPTEGIHTVEVKASAGGDLTASLPVSFMVNEMNMGKGSFTSEYPQQEGTTGTGFSSSTTLINNRLRMQSHSLSSNAPSGWGVGFTPTDETAKATTLEVESGASKSMIVSVTPPEGVATGGYDIPCSAMSAEETLNTSLRVAITGSYGLKVSTPDGCPSFDVCAGGSSDVTLDIINTDNMDLKNTTLNSSLPTGWAVTYGMENNMIPPIPVGSIAEVIVHVKPSSEATTGNYVNTFTASCKQTRSNANLRVSVKTTTIRGVVVVVIILCTAGGLDYTLRKHDRRQLVWIVSWRGVIVMDYEGEMIIRTEHLSRSCGEKEAVYDLALETRRGGVFGLLGPDGAGKATITLMPLGLTEPMGGSAYIDGKDCARQTIDVERMVGYLPGDVGFYSDIAGQENLRFTEQLDGLPSDVTDRRMEELLEKVGITEAADQKAGTYSWRMRQRLGIADVLIKDPKMVVMDEPTLGIDPEGMWGLMALIRNLAESDKRTILISFHQLYQIQQVCNRVGLSVDGRLTACGRVDELTGQMRRGGHHTLEAAVFPDDGGFEELLRSLGNVEQVERTGDFYVVHSRSDLCRELNRKILEKGYALRHLKQRGNDLGEIYRKYSEKGEQKNGGLNRKGDKRFFFFDKGQR